MIWQNEKAPRPAPQGMAILYQPQPFVSRPDHLLCRPPAKGVTDEKKIATHNSPRTWVITEALSPLAIRLIRLLLAHGDYIVACLPPHEIELEDRSAEFRELIDECKSNRRNREGWKDRIRGIRCDGRSMGQCSAALAEAVQVFGRIDVLLCCKFEGMCYCPEGRP